MNKIEYFKLLNIENLKFININIDKKINNDNLKEIIKILNNDKKIIISGLDFSGKTDTVRKLLQKSEIEDKFLYFNKKLDIENKIQTSKDLQKYITTNIQKNTKIIILQNIGFIKNIKDFLIEILNSNFHIIIVGNDIEIKNIKQIEIKIESSKNINNILYYGNIGNLSKFSNINLQKEYIILIRDKIFLDNIFNLKSVKDINLYNSTMIFLSKLNNINSIRELHNIFLENQNIAIKTFTDYLDYSEQSKIIKKTTTFDLARNKEIKTQIRYFFLDNGILNSLNHFRQKEDLLIKNLIFIQLYLYNFDIFGGRIGNYLFDFYLKGKDNNNFIIKISDEDNFKKDINKFKKINAKKIILIKDLANTNIRKKDYGDLQIIDLWDFLEKEEKFDCFD